MDATISRDELETALARVAGAVSGGKLYPVMTGVLLRSDLTVTATDGEIGIRAALTGGTTGDGWAVVAPHATLVRILRESDAADVRLTLAGDTLTVKAGAKYEVPTWPADTFPDVPTESEGGFTVAAGALRLALDRTAYAADRKDSTRFALSGVLFEAEGKRLVVVATDSKRLAVHETVIVGGPAEKTAALIPAKAVKVLLANLGDDPAAPVTVVLRANDAVFRTTGATIHTRLVEGRYPPFRDILGQTRKGVTTRLVLPVAAFAARVRMAAIMVDAESKRIDVAFGADRAVLTARGAATGASEVVLDLPGYAGPDLTIGFDPAYLGEMLKSFGGEAEVTLEMSDGTKPALFRCGDTVALIMPLAG